MLLSADKKTTRFYIHCMYTLHVYITLHHIIYFFFNLFFSCRIFFVGILNTIRDVESFSRTKQSYDFNSLDQSANVGGGEGHECSV